MSRVNPSMVNRRLPDRPSPSTEVDEFLARCTELAGAGPQPGRGRLLFALDATGSRQPTWDRAAQLQGEMFMAAAGLGTLSIQVCFYRGYGEFKASGWLSNSTELVRLMTSVSCRAGQTQISKVLLHALNETARQRLAAFVFVGDCMEEDVDHLADLAGKLGVLGVTGFVFQEGDDPVAAYAFREIARLTGGAYCRFDSSSASQLRDLLRAVAVYAAGGRVALVRHATEQGREVRLLAHQVKGG
jgi:hypothetical protein